MGIRGRRPVGKGERMDEYCRILIVDDEYIMRQGIRYMIAWEEQGFQVVGEASNGKERWN